MFNAFQLVSDSLEDIFVFSEPTPLAIETEASPNESSEVTITAFLRNWATSYEVKHTAVTSLLKFLHPKFPELPLSAKTLIQTPLQPKEILQQSGMDCIHFSLSEQISNVLESKPINQITHLHLGFNIDGLPLFKSSNKVIWPVLCSVLNVPTPVFPLTLAFGSSKPNSLVFIEHASKEINTAMENGITIGDMHFNVTVNFITCDAPAKAMVKASKLCTGYYGCDKCEQKGDWVGERGRGRVTYPYEESSKRTDETFRNQQQPQHHIGFSPFVETELDMVKAFPIDYMHQVW